MVDAEGGGARGEGDFVIGEREAVRQDLDGLDRRAVLAARVAHEELVARRRRERRRALLLSEEPQPAREETKRDARLGRAPPRTHAVEGGDGGVVGRRRQHRDPLRSSTFSSVMTTPPLTGAVADAVAATDRLDPGAYGVRIGASILPKPTDLIRARGPCALLAAAVAPPANSARRQRRPARSFSSSEHRPAPRRSCLTEGRGGGETGRAGGRAGDGGRAGAQRAECGVARLAELLALAELLLLEAPLPLVELGVHPRLLGAPVALGSA